jgi:simple sugar transport system ATP-binding protein
LKVENLSYFNREKIQVLKNINFEVREGEIVGIAGVEGNGQTELVEILTGLREASSGAVYVLGQNIVNKSVREIREMGVSHIPEDRMKNGVADKAKVKENLISDRYYKNNFSKMGILNYEYIDGASNELVKRFNILAPSIEAPVNALSGGNIQKVVVARELSSNPKVIIASQPVRGIDVGSEELVHNFIKDARDSGCAVLLVSADLDEILKLSTRILVIYNGEIVKSFDKVEGLTGVDLGPYMLGLKRGE